MTSPLNYFGGGEGGDSTDSSSHRDWRKLRDISVELPKETLLLAEKVVEYRGLVCKQSKPMPNAAIARLCQVFISCLANQKKKQKERGQVNSYAIHILDAFFVEGQNMLTEGDLNKVVSIEKRYEFFFV